MRSNFDSPLKVSDGVVEACGELDWDGETGVHVLVTLTQRGQGAVGTASSQSSIEPPADEWMLEVTAAGSNQFTPGPAQAIGVLSAVEGSGVSVFHWSQDVQLTQA